MKQIYMIFKDKEKSYVSNILCENLCFVFENQVNVKLFFLDELNDENINEADLITVLYKDRVYPMSRYINALDKVIVLSRTFQKEPLQAVLNIPAESNVLVVNDSYESTLQTTNTLYELGINHINLIPLSEDTDYSKYADTIKYAVTPNELDCIPSFIENTIDLEDRWVDLNTIISIINKLGLNNETVTRNLIRYSNLVASSQLGVSQKYFASHLKNEMLNRAMDSAVEAIILADAKDEIVYVNSKAEFIFDMQKGMVPPTLNALFHSKGAIIPHDDEFTNQLVTINNTNYMIDKNPIMILDEMTGYIINLSAEEEIKNKDSNLSKQLAKSGLVAKYRFDNVIHCSFIMNKAIELAKKAAVTNYSILINGESGTGKEVFAQSIHNFSARKSYPFVAINCAALPESLLESELFGYEKGAFTGASASGKAGLFEQAHRGTIFLDEIGDMSLHLQARLLRVLQERQIMRLGSDKVINIDIRIIAATNKNLNEEIVNKNFREDLYYRLCNIPINLPSLRARKDDILLILKHFLGSNFQQLSSKELSAIAAYNWPGNIRELENVANYYQTLSELPQNIFVPKSSIQTNSDNLSHTILSIISNNTTQSYGIGRTLLIQLLKEKNIILSDDKMRKQLEKLEKAGFITIGKGRVGNKITDLGLEKI